MGLTTATTAPTVEPLGDDDAGDVESLTTTQTAALIRAALKAAFPGAKFSVRSSTYSMGSAVDVSWTDGPATRAVDAITDAYQGSSYDSMAECKTYVGPVKVTDAAGNIRRVRLGADSVHTHHDLSPEHAARFEPLAAEILGEPFDRDKVCNGAYPTRWGTCTPYSGAELVRWLSDRVDPDNPGGDDQADAEPAAPATAAAELDARTAAHLIGQWLPRTDGTVAQVADAEQFRGALGGDDVTGVTYTDGTGERYLTRDLPEPVPAPEPAPAPLVAHRATMSEARRHFEAGGAVLVHERGDEPTVTVHRDTTTHDQTRTTWDELAAMVTMWRNRYPRQRFYIVPAAPEPAPVPAEPIAGVVDLAARRATRAAAAQAGPEPAGLAPMQTVGDFRTALTVGSLWYVTDTQRPHLNGPRRITRNHGRAFDFTGAYADGKPITRGQEYHPRAEAVRVYAGRVDFIAEDGRRVLHTWARIDKPAGDPIAAEDVTAGAYVFAAGQDEYGSRISVTGYIGGVARVKATRRRKASGKREMVGLSMSENPGGWNGWRTTVYVDLGITVQPVTEPGTNTPAEPAADVAPVVPEPVARPRVASLAALVAVHAGGRA